MGKGQALPVAAAPDPGPPAKAAGQSPLKPSNVSAVRSPDKTTNDGDVHMGGCTPAEKPPAAPTPKSTPIRSPELKKPRVQHVEPRSLQFEAVWGYRAVYMHVVMFGSAVLQTLSGSGAR